MTQIDLMDTPAAAVLKLAEGDRRAAFACVALVKIVEKAEPGAAFGPFTGLMILDRIELRGPPIGYLYDHLCGGDATKALALLHAIRLKLISPPTLRMALSGAPDLIDVDAVLARIRREMPGFAAPPKR